MNKGTNGRHKDVDTVAKGQDEEHHELFCNRYIRRKASRQVVEHNRQSTTRKADGEQADIAQHIAQQTREVVVGVPQAGAEVHKRVPIGVVEQQHQHCTHAQDAQAQGRREREALHAHHRQQEGQQAPGAGAQGAQQAKDDVVDADYTVVDDEKK